MAMRRRRSPCASRRGWCMTTSRSRPWLFAEGGREDRLEALSAALAALPAPCRPGNAPVRVEEEAPHRFRTRVEAALDYIRAGDIYQANLSRPWRGELERQMPLSAATAALYERLRAVNPAPFAALAQFQRLAPAEFLARAPGTGRQAPRRDAADRRNAAAQRRGR